MKGLSKAATVLTMLLAVPLQGQVGPRGGQRGMQGQPPMMNGAPMMGGSQMMGMGSANRILWLREELTLTEDQVESLKSVDEAAQEAHQGARLQMQGIQSQLRDGEITQGQFLDLMTAHREAMMQQRTAQQERIDAILTDEQKEQLQSFRGRGGPGQGMRRESGPSRGFRQGRGAFDGRGMGPAAGFGDRRFGQPFGGRGIRSFGRGDVWGPRFRRGIVR